MGNLAYPGGARSYHEFQHRHHGNNARWTNPTNLKEELKAEDENNVLLQYSSRKERARHTKGTCSWHISKYQGQDDKHSERVKSTTAPFLRQENLSSFSTLYFYLEQVQIQYYAHLWYAFKTPLIRRKYIGPLCLMGKSELN